MSQAWVFHGFLISNTSLEEMFQQHPFFLILIQIQLLAIQFQSATMSDSEKKELDQPKAEGGAVRNEQAVKQQAQLEMVDLARAFYNTLPPSKIVLQNGYKFTPDIDTFIRNGATFCHNLTIERGLDDRAFSGQPPEFFDKLIKHFHKTENTEEMVASLDIALARNNPAAWPASLVLLHGADIGLISKEQLDKDEVPILAEEKVFHDERKVVYSMRNKNKPMVGFKLSIHFEGEAKCYRQMTRFAAERIDAVKQQAQLEMVDLARAFYNTLPPSKIVLQNGYKFTPDIDTFIRNGATFCHNLTIERGLDDRAFSGQPPEFFDKLIKHFHKTENTEEMVASLDIALARNNPAAWPASLVLLHGADIGLISKEQLDKDEVPILAEEKVFHDERKVVYSMRNKNKPMVGFKLSIHFEGEAKCYRQMTRFAAERIDVQLDTNNFPAELKVEIVDLFPLENAVLFLSNVPNRLIINKCAPQVRGILRTIRQIATDYARTLPAPNSDGDIHLGNGHEYKPDMDIFLRYGAAHCGGFFIWHGTSDGFVGYPDNFFNDLIKYYYETKAPGNAVFYLEFQLSLTNPAPWPAALVQPQAGEMNVKVELEVKDQCETYVEYNLHNKHDSDDVFKLFIYFQEGAQCYQHMTRFAMWREGWYDS